VRWAVIDAITMFTESVKDNFGRKPRSDSIDEAIADVPPGH